MSAIDAGVVFLPRFSTLVGERDFLTAPLDVSRLGGVQFQVWRGPIRTSEGQGTLHLMLEESLDAQTWSMSSLATPNSIPILEGKAHFFSYSFRLRWFRLRLALGGTDPMVSCWAEGLLRGGGEGMWGGARGGDSVLFGEVVGRPTGERQTPESLWLLDRQMSYGVGPTPHEIAMRDPHYARSIQLNGPTWQWSSQAQDLQRKLLGAGLGRGP